MQELTREQLWQWYVVEQQTSVEIAARVGLKSNTVRARLQKAGIQIRPKGDSQRLQNMRGVDIDALAERYRAGQSPQVLADHFGTTRLRIISQLKQMGVYEAGRKYTGEHHWCTGKTQDPEHVQKRLATKVEMGSRNGPVPVPLEERFWQYVQKTNGCWLWTGTNNGLGYGMIYDTRCGEKVLAHRVSWEIHHGIIREGQNVLHRCDTPACVNPEHLFLGTHADNMADKTAKFRGRCSFKSADAITRILHLFRNGHRVRQLAEMFGVSPGTINNILSGRSYGHLTDVDRVSMQDRMMLRGRCILDGDKAIEIAGLFACGRSAADLATMFKVSVATIYNIVNGYSYGNATGIDKLPRGARMVAKRQARIDREGENRGRRKRRQRIEKRKSIAKKRHARCLDPQQTKRAIRQASVPRGPRGKLTAEEVRYIRQSRRADTHSTIELAQIFGVTPMTVYSVVAGRTYRHVTDDVVVGTTVTVG